MAELCLKCLRGFEPNANEDNTTLSENLEWCDGCGALTQIVLEFDEGCESNE